MDNITLVQSINFLSDELQQKGPIPVLHYLIDLGAKFTEFGIPSPKYIDPIKRYNEEPERTNFDFQFAGLTYTVDFTVELGYLYIFGTIDHKEEHKNKLSASTVLDLTEKIIPGFSFQYGFLDMEGEDRLTEKTIESVRLKKIFWANFFGKPYVEKYGKEFLLGAPGWKKRELSDGTIEYILTEDLFTPPDPSLENAIKEYFAPKAKIKRFDPGPIDY